MKFAIYCLDRNEFEYRVSVKTNLDKISMNIT